MSHPFSLSEPSIVSDTASQITASQLNDRYRLLHLIGQGGFGKTYLAIDEAHSAPLCCVVKQLHQHSSQRQPAIDQFHHEALRLAELGDHPQIPQLLDYFEQNGQFYLVQEQIDGQNLEQELAELGFNEAEIWQLLAELLPVLQFVHDRGVIHRDIKPANIIRRHNSGQLVLVDFGAAKSVAGASQTGTLIGSAEYAAPEQTRGKAVFASDLYSLGVTCIHLLTQRSSFDLFDSSEDIWIWREYLEQPISASLGNILDKLLQPATRRRYQSAAAVLQDLQTATVRAKVPQTKVPQTKVKQPIDRSLDFPPPHHNSDQNYQNDSNARSKACIPIPCGFSATVFDPSTQSWNYVPATSQRSGQAAFLSPRLAAAAAVPSVRSQNFLKAEKLEQVWWVFGAIITTAIGAVTIACATLAAMPNPAANLKSQQTQPLSTDYFGYSSKNR